MPPTWNLEWLNLNAGRAYPLREDSSLLDITRVVKLTNELVVDFVAVVPESLGNDLYISRILYADPTLTIIISQTGEVVTSITVTVGTHQKNTAYRFSGQGGYADMRGAITIGDLEVALQNFPQGVFDFNYEATAFEASVIRPEIRGVDSIKVRSADGNLSDPLTGIVELMEGVNIKLTVLQEATATDPAVVRIDSVATDLEEDCVCSDEHLRPDPLRLLNGVAGDDTGNITLIPGEDCLEIVAGNSEASLILKDTCSKPCCGCPEQEFLTSNMTLLKNNQDMLSTLAAELEFKQDDFFNKVLSSL